MTALQPDASLEISPAQIRRAGAIARQCTQFLAKARKRRAREAKARKRAKKEREICPR